MFYIKTLKSYSEHHHIGIPLKARTFAPFSIVFLCMEASDGYLSNHVNKQEISLFYY
uniref:Uncharacterized protein n=1 Tax=Arundo donax TaxID=35708 RepID=A0A0A9C3R0_ARUDO